MGLSRQEYWSWLACPPPGDPPNPGTEHLSFMSPALAGWIFTISTTWEARNNVYWGSTTCQAIPFFLNYFPKWKTGITDTQRHTHTHTPLAIKEISHSCFQFQCHPLSLVCLFSHEGWHQLESLLSYRNGIAFWLEVSRRATPATVNVYVSLHEMFHILLCLTQPTVNQGNFWTRNRVSNNSITGQVTETSHH